METFVSCSHTKGLADDGELALRLMGDPIKHVKSNKLNVEILVPVSIFSISPAITKWDHSLVAVILPAIRSTEAEVFRLSKGSWVQAGITAPKESQP